MGAEHVFAHQFAGAVKAALDCAILLAQSVGNLGDRLLFSRRAPSVLRDESLEVLSERPIDIDSKLAG